MPDRFQPARNRLAEIVLLLMLIGVVLLSGTVMWSLLKGDVGEQRIEGKVDAQLALIEDIIREGRIAGQANTCTNFQNQRAIEEALRDIARLNGIVIGDPRVLPSRSTVEACRAAGVPIKDGVPALGVLPE